MNRYINADYLLEKIIEKYKSAKGQTKAAYRDVIDMVCAMKDISDMIGVNMLNIMLNARNKEIKEYTVSDMKKLKADFNSKEGVAFQDYMDMLIGKEKGE